MKFIKYAKPLLLILLLSIPTYFAYNYWLGLNTISLTSSINTLTINTDQDLYFYSQGLIITGRQPLFYDWQGIETAPPFNQGDIDGNVQDLRIIKSTDKYLLTHNGKIFSTASTPFTLVYDNPDINIQSIEEYSDFLILLVKNKSNNLLEPYILIHGSSFLMAFEGLGDTRYISLDVAADTKLLSLLTVSIDSMLPISRLVHYTNRNESYGVLSIDDMLVYQVYRLRNHVILIGNHTVMCYNISGEAKPTWSIDHTQSNSYQHLKVGDTMLLYSDRGRFSREIIENAILIKRNGDYERLFFPKYLTYLQTFKKGFVGLEFNNYIVFMDKQGKISSKQRLDKSIKWMKTTSYQPNSLFILSNENELFIYNTTIGKEDIE